MGKLGVNVHLQLYGAIVTGDYIPPPSPPKSDDVLFNDNSNVQFNDGSLLEYNV
jgi:hypothetical protein